MRDYTMQTRESLEQLSEERLQDVYEEKKAEYDQRLDKNQRISEILENKLLGKEKTISELRTEIDLLRVKHPKIKVVAKRDFDDDPDTLRDKLLTLQKDLINLQTKQLNIKKELKQINMDIVKKEADEKFLQQEIEQLTKSSEKITNDDQDEEEKMQLAVIMSEYQTTHDLLDALTIEVEELYKKLYERS